MGVTLTLEDFKDVLTKPALITIGLTLQYTVMPFTAFLLSKALELEPELMLGMVLVGASAGGTASNVITYLARGNVALSISLTIFSTFLAIMMLPAYTILFASQSFDIPALSMVINIFRIVVIPVLAGILMNRFFHAYTRKIEVIFPGVSALAIIWIIAIIVALNQEKIADLGFLLAFAVMLHNLVGLTAGYLVPRLMGYGVCECRTIAIETGMQNSGLSVAIAVKYFTPLAALPGAIFSIWHNVTGSLLAGYWSRNRKLS
jgi:BASS family bile acid:Na+ symporter